MFLKLPALLLHSHVFDYPFLKLPVFRLPTFEITRFALTFTRFDFQQFQQFDGFILTTLTNEHFGWPA